MEGAVWMWMILFVLWTAFKVHQEYQYRRWWHGDRDMRDAIAEFGEKVEMQYVAPDFYAATFRKVNHDKDFVMGVPDFIEIHAGETTYRIMRPEKTIMINKYGTRVLMHRTWAIKSYPPGTETGGGRE
jgi:hypothetical protein